MHSNETHKVTVVPAQMKTSQSSRNEFVLSSILLDGTFSTEDLNRLRAVLLEDFASFLSLEELDCQSVRILER